VRAGSYIDAPALATPGIPVNNGARSQGRRSCISGQTDAHRLPNPCMTPVVACLVLFKAVNGPLFLIDMGAGRCMDRYP
jgi:hypothetical protein